MTRRVVTMLFWIAGLLAGSGTANAAQYQFSWLHPRPQANTIGGVAFEDPAHGYAVGDRGTVIETTDGGTTWHLVMQYPALTPDLQDLLVLGPGRLLAVGAPPGIFVSLDSGRSWNPVPNPSTATLVDVAAIDGSILSAVGNNGQVLRSLDGGTTWSLSIAPGGNLRDQLWRSASDGYLLGLTAARHTTDGGATWNALAGIPDTGPFNEAFSTDAQHGYIFSDFQVYRTTNGGANWTGSFPPNDLVYIDDTVVLGPANFLVSTDLEGATIFETTDAGGTWTTSLQAGGGGFRDLDLLADGSVIAASSDGDIFRSTDGGTNWSNGIEAASPDRNTIGAVNISPTGRGVAGTSATPNIQWYLSNDHGASWTLDPAGPNIPFTRQIEYWDADHAIAAGAVGVAWRTTNGGTSWTAVSLPGSPPNGAAWHLSLPSPGVAFAAVTGQSQSVVFRTTDFGATWQLKSTGIPIAGGLTSVFALPSGTVYAAGYNSGGGHRLFRSIDNGESWTAVTSTGITGWTWDMHWHDGQVGLASVYLSPGGIYRTIDGGATWQNAWTTPARELSFSDPLHGFATNGGASGPGSLAVTEDGGVTWQSLVLPAAKGGTTVTATATGCLVGGGNGEILEVTRLDAQAVDAPAGDDPGSGSETSTSPSNRLQVRHSAGSGFDITFELAEAGSADLTVVDVLGRRVAGLARGSYDAGVAQTTTWDVRGDDGTRMPAGIYFVRLSDRRSVRAVKLVVAGN